MIITKKEADLILHGASSVSVDLGMKKADVSISSGNALILDQSIPLDELKKVKEDACYLIQDNSLIKIAFFSDESNFYYKLLPTKDWPTFTLSSTPMHRHKHISPRQDTMLKIKEISPVKGRVLDTCCGMGYTAIAASKNAEVYTFERDPYVVHIASLNPFSKELFNNPKIHLHQESVFDAITRFNGCFFDRIIHDPPTFRYSPELYSSEFYIQLYRTLRPGGILYHYCPAPQKTQGRKFYLSVIKRLKAVGFKDAHYNDLSSGIRAVR